MGIPSNVTAKENFKQNATFCSKSKNLKKKLYFIAVFYENEYYIHIGDKKTIAKEWENFAREVKTSSIFDKCIIKQSNTGNTIVKLQGSSYRNSGNLVFTKINKKYKAKNIVFEEVETETSQETPQKILQETHQEEEDKKIKQNLNKLDQYKKIIYNGSSFNTQKMISTLSKLKEGASNDKLITSVNNMIHGLNERKTVLDSLKESEKLLKDTKNNSMLIFLQKDIERIEKLLKK